MRKDLLIIALGLVLANGAASADILATPQTTTPPAATPPSLPAKGTTMTNVEKKYGAPARKRPTVGGDTPKHPPITRWDYDAFSVFFEHDKVVDAVIPGAPPALHHTEQLTPVASSAPALPPSTAPGPMVPPPVQAEEFKVPAAEAAPFVSPAEMQVKEPPAAEAAAAPVAPAEPIAPAESTPPPPAPPAPAPQSYPDRPATTESDIPDAPPTPK
jgi:hypothetical protein